MSAPELPFAFVAKITAAAGRESELAALMTSAVGLAEQEEGTIVWFAARTDESTFWVFDAFADESGRQAHAGGQIVAALQANAELLGGPPEIMPADVLAQKLP
jgi:quinol monooxygenase YgiN